ncbi:hypothetical protein [Candidatus Thiodiazotropha sp. LNASS1]|uniref:hypothetical protein n=1 Tax=Candidatus Thiodiazotropha sp. LNASS1 TaxID=3096260 RepID=UPI0034DE9C1F
MGKMGLTDTFNLFNAAPTEMGRLAYASTVSGINSSHKTVNTTHSEKKKRDREDAISDLAELANETIRQSYERFQATYDDVTAFYDDADDRLDYLETQINAQIQGIESRTELLTGANGAAVYQDEQGVFYTVRDGERMAVTDGEELEALREQVNSIKADGQVVRTEAQQDRLVELTVLLTEALDLRGDVRDNRQEADTLKDNVEDDPSQAPEAEETLQYGRDDVEQRLEELEQKVEGLDANGRRFNQQHSFDQTPDDSVINKQMSSLPDKAPAAGFDLS